MPAKGKGRFTTGNDVATLTSKKGETVYALDGNDAVTDLGSDDTVYLGAGDDRMVAGRGTNLYDGGLGFDTLDFRGASTGDQPLYINLLAGYAVDASGFNVGVTPAFGSGQSFNSRISGFESVDGAVNVPNTIIGDLGANILTGGDKNDYLSGLAGDDVLSGEGGDDYIRTGPGADGAYGGDGNDTFVYFREDAGGMDTLLDFGSNPDEFDTIAFVGAQSIVQHAAPGGIIFVGTWDDGTTQTVYATNVHTPVFGTRDTDPGYLLLA